MTAGMYQTGATFVPLAASSTTLSASIPGFLTTTAATHPVTVTDP